MRIILTLTIIWLCVLPAQARDACNDTSAYNPVAERSEKTLLYQVSKCGAKTGYVFGTFHSDSPKLLPSFNKALSVFDVVDAVALEVVQDASSQRKAQRALMLPHDHDGLKSLLSATSWQKMVSILAPTLHMQEAQLNRFKPWSLAVLAQYPPAEADGVILDVRIQRRAAAGNLELVALESIEHQFHLFESLGLEQQIQFLELTLDDMQDMPAMHAQLTRLYLAEDTNGIMAMSDGLFDEMATKNPELAYYLRTELLDQRNIRMAKKMASQLEKTPTLFAIGALHLPGEMGVLQLLEDKGYRVTPID